jgi:uncharacterized repeat protein (TIGR02543 family)
MLLTTATAWATNITTHITYAGLTADDVTFTLSGNGTSFELKDGEKKSVGDISGPQKNFTITCSSALNLTSVSYSGTWEMPNWGTPSFNKNSNNGCTFKWGIMYGDLTLYINVSYSFTGYTVHFDPNKGGNGTMSDQAIATGVATALSPCTFTGNFNNVFVSWNTAANGSGTAYSDQQSVTDLAATGETITLYAQWVAGYIVHFDANGGMGTMVDQGITKGNYAYLRANAFTRDGYIFTGWNTAADGSGTSHADCERVLNLAATGETITLYAQWAAGYTVHFNANGGTGTMSDQTIAVGATTNLTSNAFTRDGYVFVGWSDTADGNVVYTNGQSVTDLATADETFNLYAQWREIVTANYVDASGDAHTLSGCVEITPDYMPTTLAGNYVVKENVTYTSKVTLSGNTTIILANGKTMSIGTEAAPLGGDYALYDSGTNSLTIYGQSLDAATAGNLEVYSTGYFAVKLYEGSYTQHSGNVKVVNSCSNSSNDVALQTSGSVTIDGGNFEANISSPLSAAILASGNISISGGSVTANATGADSYGMKSVQGNITLTWTRATDRITASSYRAAYGTISLNKRFAFDLGGTITLATTANMGGKTLRPAVLVTFDTNGGSDVSQQPVIIGTAAIAPTPTLTGYDLSGWTLCGAAYDFATAVTEDITLTAQWTLHTYTITYNGVDGATFETANPTTYTILSDAITLNNPSKTDYTFTGWTVSNGDTPQPSVTIATNSHEDKTYTANWKKLLSNNDITIADISAQTYTGSAISPDVTVSDGETALVLNTDYTVDCSDNVNAGTATMTITGMGNYDGTVEKTFTISPASVTLTANSDTKEYNGAEQTVTGFTSSVNGLTFTGVSASGSGTDTGSYDVIFTDVTLNTTKDDTGNYVVTETTNGTLTITDAITNYGAAKITWNQNGKTATFDGTSVATISITEDIAVDAVVLNRTFTVDKPATIMLPFNYTCNGSEGGKFYTFAGVEQENSQWIATMKDAEDPVNKVTTLTANTPYLVMPSATSLTFAGGATLNTTGGGSLQTAESGSHWTFKGTYSYIKWTSDTSDNDYTAEHEAEIGKVYGFAGVQKTDIEVGDFVRVASGAKIRPMSCYLQWNDTPATTRSTRSDATEELPSRITVRLLGANGNTTSIENVPCSMFNVQCDSWYTLDGRKLAAKPTQRGIYINNGKKVVIK